LIPPKDFVIEVRLAAAFHWWQSFFLRWGPTFRCGPTIAICARLAPDPSLHTSGFAARDRALPKSMHVARTNNSRCASARGGAAEAARSDCRRCRRTWLVPVIIDPYDLLYSSEFLNILIIVL
jgi:hypothetical protein